MAPADPVGLHYYETRNDSVLAGARALAAAAVRASGKDYKSAAADIAARMESEHGGCWSCAVGPEYGSYVHYQPDAYMCFDVGDGVMVTLYSPP